MPGMKKSKGYAKGGAKMMRAKGGKMANKMAKGMSKGGAKVKPMTVAQLRAAAKKMGMKVTKA
tara:strand:- start:1064 stop:1252 length:189 start_codon:yes stop_codon:yes gene_type:complete